MGTYHLGKVLGYKNVIASDVGGTSFDLGLVVDAGVRSYEFRPIIDRWMGGHFHAADNDYRGRWRVYRSL